MFESTSRYYNIEDASIGETDKKAYKVGDFFPTGMR